MQAFSSRDETVPAPAPNGTRVLYTNDPSVCDAVSAFSEPALLHYNARRRPPADERPHRCTQWALGVMRTGSSGVLGFDIEWRPQFRAGGTQHRTALLQLAAADSCLCLQLAHMRAVPAKLRKLLADPQWVKCGVGILEDCVKLSKDWTGTEVTGRVDVGEVYLQHVGATDGHSVACGIKALSTVLLDEEISKPKKVSMSNWENRPLTGPQLRYAALDAWVGYAAYIELANRGEQAKLIAARRDGSSEEEMAEVKKAQAIRRAQKQKERERNEKGRKRKENARAQQKQQGQQKQLAERSKRASGGGRDQPVKKQKQRRANGGSGKIAGASGSAAAALADIVSVRIQGNNASVTVGSPNSRMVVKLAGAPGGAAGNGKKRRGKPQKKGGGAGR